MDQLVDRDGYTSSWFFGSAGVNHVNSVNRHGSCQKKLHRRIFRLKVLHLQFHLFSTVLVKKTQKMSENGEIYTISKNFTLPPAVTASTNSTSDYDHLCFDQITKPAGN